MDTLGIDIGSTSVKVVCLADGRESWEESVAHDGDIRGALTGILDRRGVARSGIKAIATGGAGR